MRPSDKIVATLKEYGGKMCKFAYVLQRQYYYTDEEMIDEYDLDINEVNDIVDAGSWVYSFAVKQEVNNNMTVIEQAPCKDSIFCKVLLSDCSYGNMYFVCGLDRNIHQYQSWMTEYRRQLEKLGYKFN